MSAIENKYVPTNADKKGGGGKQNKSETMTVRLDPKLRFSIELASRNDRRTASNIIEIALMQYLSPLTLAPWLKPEESIKLSDLVDQVWDIDNADRLLNLKRIAPWALSPDEERCLKLFGSDNPNSQGVEAFRRNFQAYMDVAAGRADIETLKHLK